MAGGPQSLRHVAVAATATALAAILCLGVVSFFVDGFSSSTVLGLLQGLAIFGLGVLIVGGAVVFALVRLADWRDPASEAEFEALVQRSEMLAAGESWEDIPDAPDPYDDDDDDIGIDPTDEDDFRLLVRQALDELPLEFHRALEHVAIVVADNGRSVGPLRARRRGAYGLYQGDTIAHEHFHERIVIFRDTLVRDFGHDPDLLRSQVTRTVRHELAHHLGWDEKGVRGLGL